MSRWDHRRFGTADDPIRQSALNSLASQNGCPQRFAFERRAEAAGTLPPERPHWKRVLGTAVHAVIERALGREPMASAVLAGKLPSDTRVHDVLEEELGRAAGGKAIEWLDANAATEKWAARHMVLGALRSVAERARRIVAVEAPFVVELDGYHMTGTIDLAIEPREEPGTVALADWKTGERRLAQVVLDHGYQIAIYSHALAEGVLWPGTERETHVGMYPSAAYVAHLRDFVPYIKGPKTGKLRGPGWYKARRTAEDVARLRVSLRNVVGTVRMGRFVEQIGEQCARCPFRGPCFGAGEHVSADEARQLEIALAGIDLSDVLPDVA